jgi:hypothetical protein
MVKRKNCFFAPIRPGMLLICRMPGGCLGRFTGGGPVVYLKNELCRAACTLHRDRIGS